MTALVERSLSPRVTEATESDAEEICKVVNAAYKRDFFRYPERSRTTYEKIQGYFLDGTHTWYVIKLLKEGIPEIAAAMLYSTDLAPESATEGNIHMLSARPSDWGKRLSSLLLRKGEERALRDKKSNIRLIVANTSIGLIKLYARHGYRLTGEKFQLPVTSLQPQYQEKNPDGSFKICCWHMEKELLRSHL
jgi:ribosomal protein S18 acetylase RimI-like enzyme